MIWIMCLWKIMRFTEIIFLDHWYINLDILYIRVCIKSCQRIINGYGVEWNKNFGLYKDCRLLERVNNLFEWNFRSSFLNKKFCFLSANLKLIFVPGKQQGEVKDYIRTNMSCGTICFQYQVYCDMQHGYWDTSLTKKIIKFNKKDLVLSEIQNRY